MTADPKESPPIKQKPPEEPVAAEVEEVEEPEDAFDENLEPVTAEELKESVHEVGDRAKTVGLRPFRKMVRDYTESFFSAVDGLLETLEGKKKK